VVKRNRRVDKRTLTHYPEKEVGSHGERPRGGDGTRWNKT
jgi:hypothetical protein